MSYFGGAKFRNLPTRCSQGGMHQSRLESMRCTELHLLQKGGLIRDLEAHPQPRFDLEVNGTHVCHYLADFRYVDVESGQTVVEDTKGVATAEYRLKRRLMLACHGVEIQEVRRVRGAR